MNASPSGFLKEQIRKHTQLGVDEDHVCGMIQSM